MKTLLNVVLSVSALAAVAANAGIEECVGGKWGKGCDPSPCTWQYFPDKSPYKHGWQKFIIVENSDGSKKMEVQLSGLVRPSDVTFCHSSKEDSK